MSASALPSVHLDSSSLAVVGDLSTTLFALGQRADELVNASLSDVTPVTYAVVLVRVLPEVDRFPCAERATLSSADQLCCSATQGAGLLTSLSPCTLSVLPLTIGYIGGTSSASAPGSPRPSRAPEAAAFAGGLATTLALLGVLASLAGKAYGQVGDGLPVLVSLLAIAMGLNLLEVVRLPLPSFFTDVDVRQAGGLSSAAKAYLAGLTFALAASPCSTPVLASLLGYVASTGDPVRGGTLLLAYTRCAGSHTLCLLNVPMTE